MCETVVQTLIIQYQFNKFCSYCKKSCSPPFPVSARLGKPLDWLLPPLPPLLGSNNQTQPMQETHTTVSSDQRGLVWGSYFVLIREVIKESEKEEICNVIFREGQRLSLCFSHSQNLLSASHSSWVLWPGEEPGYAPSPTLNQEGGKDLTALIPVFVHGYKWDV